MQNKNKLDDINYYFPTVFEAIRSAGGLTTFSDLSNIQVIRKDAYLKEEGKFQLTLIL